MKLQAISYYAWARDPQGKIRQLFVVREEGKPFRQRWTAKTYKSDQEAAEDIRRVNCK